MRLFLNLRNPIFLTTKNPAIELLQKLYGDKAEEIYNERYQTVYDRDFEEFNRRVKNGEITGDLEKNFDRYIRRRIITGEEVKRLLAQGFDGINWNNAEYSVINPAQIKSATGNNGDFDASNTG